MYVCSLSKSKGMLIQAAIGNQYGLIYIMGYWRRDMRVAIHVISIKYFAYLIIFVSMCVCAPVFAFFKKTHI